MPLIQYGQFQGVIESLTRITEASDTRITEAGDIRVTELTATNNQGVGSLVAAATYKPLNAHMYVRVGGVWKESVPSVKHEGSWKLPIIYKKISGKWKRIY